MENIVNSSVADTIQLKQKLIIPSDGSTSKSVSGGVWIIADIMGKTFISDTNPDFGHITQIHSHRAKIYGVLSVLAFIKEYSNYLMLPFLSTVAYYCDNLEAVHKIIKNPSKITQTPSTNNIKQLIMMSSYN